MHKRHSILIISLLMAGFLLCGNAWSSQAGLVQFVHGNVMVTDVSGSTRAAHKGGAINEGDTLVSAQDASAQIRMNDGGFIAVRPNTRLKFDSFKFTQKQDEPESAIFSLFKGGFRAITGLIGRIRHEDYKITTPVATIGIRGTDHETVMVLPNDPMVLAGQAAPGAYNKVNVGETSITTNRGTINVLPNQMGFAGGLNQMPQIQPINTNLFTVVPPPAPNEKLNGGNQSGESTERATAVVDTTAEAVSGGTQTNDTGGSTTTTNSVLTTSTPPTVVNTPTTVLGAAFVNTEIAYDVANNFIGTGVGVGSPSNVSPMPYPTSFVFNYGGGGCTGCYSSIIYQISGGTPTVFPTSSTGAQWGYWTNPSQVTETFSYPAYAGIASVTSPIPSPGVTSWITAPAANPFYLPQVLLGSATYNLVGGVATDGINIGTLNSAQLNVNFTQQLVGLALNATVNGVNWSVTGSGAPLTGSGQQSGQSNFNFDNSCGASCGNGTLSATVSGGNTFTYGTASGALTGQGLTGAILSYSLIGSADLSGVAALGLSAATPINTSTSWLAALDSVPTLATTGTVSSGYTYPVTMDTVNGSPLNAATIQVDGSGNPTAWLVDGYWIGSVGTVKQTIAGATAVDTGTDAVSGIKWGRWSGGTFNFTTLAGSPITSVNNPAGGMHWIATPTVSGPISLPVSGTYNYVVAGFTNPTDQNGNVGTLNSASLTANFTAMTVNVGANVSVPGATFNASATNVPINQGTFFEVGANANSVGGFLTCSGTGCGNYNSGHAIGVFTQNGVGAALSYGFETGTQQTVVTNASPTTTFTPSTVVGGVVAFHR